MKNITAHLVNLARQRRTVGDRTTPITVVGRNSGRDGRTGNRRLIDPSGGVRLARYISNSVPDPVPALLVPGRIGLSGNVDQKPS